MATPTLYLIDGSGFIFRAYHALPPLTRADGTPVGAVLGFCNMLHRLAGELKATHGAVIFDAARKTFRNDIYPEYKAHRPEPPEDLRPQFPIVKEAARAFGFPSIESQGFEADDLIASYARAAREKGWEVVIVSSDKDLMQLIGEGVRLHDPLKNRPIGAAEVQEKFGVGPEKVVDVQALIGDATDNVPGVEGIGPKAASAIMQEISSLDEILLSDNAFVLAKKLNDKIAVLEESVEKIAGRKVKVTSAEDVAEVILEKGFAKDLPKNKKGKFAADTDVLEQLAAQGNVFCKNILGLRQLPRLLEKTIPHLFKNKAAIELSRKLVQLDAQAQLPVPVDALRVDERRDVVTPFLQQQGFKNLLARLGAPGPAAAAAPAVDQKAAEAPPVPAPEVALVATADYMLVQNESQLKAWVAEIQEQGFVAVDTETDSLLASSATLVGISLATRPGRACYIPLGHVKAGGAGRAGELDLGGQTLPHQLGRARAIELLKPVLENDAILKIGHNLKYDMQVLGQHGVTITPLDDTMLISFVLDAGVHGHGLDELAALHVQHKMISYDEVTGTGQKRISFAEVPLDRACAYAAEDADFTLRLYHLLKPRLRAEGLLAFYERFERPMVATVAQMEREGIRIDAGVLAGLSRDFTQRLAALEELIVKEAGVSFNIASPKQMGEVLFDKLGLPGGKKGKTGAYSTSSDVLEPLAEQGYGIVEKILDWRALAKLKSTYTDALPQQIAPRTGRVHTSFSLVGAATGRLSSTEPNLQNIPIRTEDGRAIRRAFVAEKGFVLLSADYSQIELRLCAHMAGVEALKKAFREGHDIHAATAAQVFSLPLAHVTSEQRRQAKAINFGIIYGISGFGLAKQLGCTPAEASAFIRDYLARFPELKDFMERTKDEARRKGYVETLFGRRCHIRGIHEKNAAMRNFAERQAINAPLQGSAADIMKRAMVHLPDTLKENGLKARMLLQVHDELLFEVPEGEQEATARLVKSQMEGAASLSVPLVVDAGFGHNWADAH